MAPRLQNLPHEILENIFENLCFHCQNSGATSVPDFDTKCGLEQSQSLANLCQTSRSICAAAQPILFHSFALSSSSSSSSSSSTSTTTSRRPLKRRLHKFVRTLSQRPDLARAVRTIELLPPPDWNDAYPFDTSTWHTLQQQRQQEQQHDQKSQGKRADFSDEIVELGGNGGSGSSSSTALPLALVTPHLVNMTSNLEYLRIVAPSLETFDGWGEVKPLPRMRVLEVVSPCEDQHFRMVDLPNVFRVMPNLEAFRGSSHMRLSCEHHFSGEHTHTQAPNLCDHKPWDIVPSTLTKAVVGHVDVFRLATLFDNCPRLEDLEVFLVPGIYDWENASPPDGSLVASRDSLRRLVVTMHDWLGWIRFPGMFDKRTGPAGISGRANLALRKMNVLEDLAVDQCLLHADVVHATGGGDAADQLSAALPETLRSLHVGYVVSWKHLQPQLRNLAARKKAGYFRDLTSVRIDPYTTSTVTKLDLDAERRVLADAGVSFVVGVNPPTHSGRSQQMLTPSPGSRYNE